MSDFGEPHSGAAANALPPGVERSVITSESMRTTASEKPAAAAESATGRPAVLVGVLNRVFGLRSLIWTKPPRG